MQSSQIEERRGTAPSAGTTFATKADADEALARGQVDWSKNPFVPNVCQLIHSKTEAVFLDLTRQSEWIERSIARLSSRR